MMTTTLNATSNTNKFNTENPEIELILCCAHTNLSTYAIQKVKALLEQNLNWQYIIKTASIQGVLPLIYYNLNSNFSQQVPADILLQLRQYFQANTRKVLLLTSELLNILKTLEANQIEAITFKGATLAVTAYKQLALRQFCDLDILIKESDSLKVVDLLVSLGYQLPDPIANLEERPYMAYEEFLESEETQKKYNLFHPQKQVAIDLQWSLTERRINRFFPVDFQHLKTHSYSLTLGGSQVKQFSLEDMLLYLCFHGSKHCWSELKWICDVAEFIQANPDIDWQIVSFRAEEWKVERMLGLGLFLVEDLLRIDPPEAARQNLKVDRVIKKLSYKVKQGIFDRPLTETEKIAFRFKLRNKLSEQILFFADILFTPTAKEWNFLPFTLPKSISFLYRFVRPYRLITGYLTNQPKG